MISSGNRGAGGINGLLIWKIFVCLTCQYCIGWNLQPIRCDSLKRSPSFTIPASLNRAIEASAAEAKQPHSLHTGRPPIWHGITGVLRSGEKQAVVWAKIQSWGEGGGWRYPSSMMPGAWTFGKSFFKWEMALIALVRSSNVSLSSEFSPFCGV